MTPVKSKRRCRDEHSLPLYTYRRPVSLRGPPMPFGTSLVAPPIHFSSSMMARYMAWRVYSSGLKRPFLDLTGRVLRSGLRVRRERKEERFSVRRASGADMGRRLYEVNKVRILHAFVRLDMAIGRNMDINLAVPRDKRRQSSVSSREDLYLRNRPSRG